MLKKPSIMKSAVTLSSRHTAAGLEGRNDRKTEIRKKRKCTTQLLMIQETGYSMAESDMKICENTSCIWKGCREGMQNEFRTVTIMKPSVTLEPELRLHITGLRNDYYLNILDWNLENLIAVALGSAAYIWNGRTLQGIESIELNSSSKYISSLAWIKEGTCLAVGTSDGEVQLWDIERKRRLRSMFGHLSVVGALSWNHYILSSGSRLGSIHHHDVRVAQHHIGTLCQNKQSICSLKWSLTNQLLASGSSDGTVNIWHSDPGVNVKSQPLKTIPHSSAVKAMNWCPWQSNVLATGGGMKDGILRVWDINHEKLLQSAATDSQICSLLWLPKTSELMTGQGLPENQMKIWQHPALINSSELYGHKGRVLHMALSPDQRRLFSVAADDSSTDDSDINFSQGIRHFIPTFRDLSPSCYATNCSLFEIIPRDGCSDISGGRCVRAHSRPFMAAIQRANTTVCGGVLVKRQWVLTAAHCKLEDLDASVVLGAHRAFKTEKQQQRFEIMDLFPHPQFDSDSKENDIMLLKLDHMANLNKYVNVLSLPDTGEDVKPGTKCTVSGWGETSPGKLPKCLREATVEIVDRKSCERKYKKTSKRLNVTRNMLCAGGRKRFSKRDACKGDSGGPLICGRKYSGIVSFGEECGMGDKPGVYTRLTEKYMDWIKKTVSLNGEA